MQNAIVPEFEEPSKLPPINLTPQQKELCSRLDTLNQKTIKGQNLSKMLIGALFAIREECRSNPDWMAQSAHSFREILYPFYKARGNYIKNAFEPYGSVTFTEETFKNSLDDVYGNISDVAHHKFMSVEDYEKLIEDFQRVLFWALTRQVDVHNQIDEFFSENKPEKGR